MAVYSISDLEKLSGIKAHTIRMWEQRYGIIQPQRTETNIRFYQDHDLQLLLNIALLNRHGFKISKIAAMSRQEITEAVGSISELKVDLNEQIDVLTLAVIEMDEYKFTRIFDNHAAQIGFERTMLEVAFPFLEKLSLLWLTGSIKPVQENFITQLIRHKLIAAIEKEPLAPNRKAPKFLLYLPREEQQEISLLFMHYLLKARKFQVVNVGGDIALIDLKDACHIYKPEYIFTILSENFHKEPVQRYIENLALAASGCRLLLTGYFAAAQIAKMPAGATVFSHLSEALDFMDNLKVEN